MRKFSSSVSGGNFSASDKLNVWNKGTVVSGYDSSKYRKDSCGAWMQWDKYGDTSSAHGWEIDHIKPVSQGGTDVLTNLQPLQWQNNRHKSDNWPNWTCKLKAAS